METPRYRIDHIHYRVLDPEAASAFWRDQVFLSPDAVAGDAQRSNVFVGAAVGFEN
jgi:catechol-2,3-dioxygenase